MSYYLVVGGEDWKQVASLSGWAEFREGAEGHDAGELHHLIDHGWSQDIPALEEQLSKVVEEGEPSGDVEDIATAILDALEGRQPGHGSVVLTDGLAEQDDPDDSGWTSEED
jgi:hypothetical protein